MLKGCDVLDQIANICSKNINEPVDVFISSVEVNSLLITFEACAKSCAGDYYVAKFIIIKLVSLYLINYIVLLVLLTLLTAIKTGSEESVFLYKKLLQNILNFTTVKFITRLKFL